jgi:hemolysin III
MKKNLLPRWNVIPPHLLYTVKEEIANSLTHGVGVVLSIIALIALILLARKYGNMWVVFSFTVYGVTQILVYLSSTLYHSIQHPQIKQIFQVIDHSTIFLLIAGAHTPFLIIALGQKMGWLLLMIVWGLAFLGVGYKVLFVDKYQQLSSIGYVLMAFVFALAGKALFTTLSKETLILIGVGGASYLLGLIFAAWRQRPYSHAVWHLFVIGGSLSHFFAVLHLLPGYLNPVL